MSKTLETNINLAVISGEVSRTPQQRVLRSGEAVVNLDVKVRPEGCPAHNVPVSWMGAPAWALELEPGQAVIVTGRVRQQWFGSANKFTDVLAENVVRVNTASALRKVLASAMVKLKEAAP